MAAKTYSFLSCTCALVGPGGAISLGSGAGNEDEGISFEPAEDISTMEVGPDGNGQHSLHGNRSGRVTVRILKRSVTNGLLMAMFNFQTQNPANHGQNTITLVDQNTGDVATCQQVAFRTRPTLKFAKIAGFNEWVFDAVSMEFALGLT